MADRRRKLIFLVTEDWYFWSHRLPMARAARDAGFAVAVATRVTAHGERIAQEGFTLHPLNWRRRDFGLWANLAALYEIHRLYRRERPSLVHHVALKPAIIGGIAARLARVPRIVSMIAGMGYASTGRSWHQRLAQSVFRWLWPILLLRANGRIIVQNPEDRDAIAASGAAARQRIFVIPGSGVDLDRFSPLPEPPEPPIVAAYVGRMIAIKGVETVVAAQQQLRREGVALDLVLAGKPDPDNPSSHDEVKLRRWSELPGITWCGHREDVRAVWAGAHIAVLGSLGGEGLPKTLIEAAALGRAIVATDVPGARDVARDGVNALLAPPGNSAAFAAALKRLAGDPARRRRYAEAGRRLVEAEFSDVKIAAATVAVYRSFGDLA